MPYLTSQIYEKRYFGSVLSSAQIGCVIMYVIIVLLPFFLAFATNGEYTQFLPHIQITFRVLASDGLIPRLAKCRLQK